tara:strand:+ start:39757 stop:40752 length:996 start_codon:yes stop_codon:yes gene_type:complete
MAEIRFQLLKNSDGTAALDTLSGSGLAFYGATAGSSVQIGAYQGVTRVANSSGSSFQDEASNIKYKANTFPSGQCNIGGAFGTATDIGLSGIKTFQGTLGIEFGHTSEVKAQNCQLRIYDRSNVNHPASGVNTKVAEIINFNGSTFNNQGADGSTSDAVGSGDAFWWGEPWPSELVSKNYYTNSTAVTFYNGKSSDTVVNGDARLATVGLAGSYSTVGGTGIVVPLVDSPGSGGKFLQNSETISGTGMVWPKWTQYITTTSNQQTYFGGSTAYQFGDGSDTTKVSNVAPIDRTFGGTGVSTHHTWSVAITASPLSTGSKEDYGLYVSLEYL